VSRSTDDPFEEPGYRLPSDRNEPRDESEATAGAGRGDAVPPDAAGSSGAHADGDPRAASPSRASTPVTQWIGRVVIVLLAVLFGVFAVDNSQAVDFFWVFGDTRVAPDGSGGVPLIALLLAAAAIGAALGALIEWQFLRGRRARRAERDRNRD
jgi:uncharacterized integral membrane protein